MRVPAKASARLSGGPDLILNFVSDSCGNLLRILVREVLAVHLFKRIKRGLVQSLGDLADVVEATPSSRRLQAKLCTRLRVIRFHDRAGRERNACKAQLL